MAISSGCLVHGRKFELEPVISLMSERMEGAKVSENVPVGRMCDLSKMNILTLVNAGVRQVEVELGPRGAAGKRSAGRIAYATGASDLFGNATRVRQ
jgi:hypothetical protein